MSNVAFSLDGITRESHDRWRGKGSFDRLVRAFSRCYMSNLPFAIKIVIRRDVMDQLEQIAIFAARMGAASLHFAHVMPTSGAVEDESALTLEEQRVVEEEIAVLRRIFKMDIGIDVGYYNIDETRPPCAPLAGTSMNIDFRGRLSLCCNLSGFRGAAEELDVVADLNVESFGSCVREIRRAGCRAIGEEKSGACCVAIAIVNSGSLYGIAMSVLSSKLRQDSVALDAFTKGWLPVDADVVDGRPGLWWMDMSDVSLTEPFFQQTVERAKAENKDRGVRFTEFDVLLQLEKVLDSVPPTGFIFHSSRCGSTLVANACRAITNSIVLSEANAIDKLIARFITDAPDGSVKESIYSVLLRGVVHALGQRRTGSEQHLFVKFACCSFAQIERVKRIWPRGAMGFSLSRSG